LYFRQFTAGLSAIPMEDTQRGPKEQLFKAVNANLEAMKSQGESSMEAEDSGRLKGK